MAPRNSRVGSSIQILRAIGTPLGFYVLSLLILESILGLVLIKADSLDSPLRWFFSISMVLMFFSAFAVVTYFTAKNPKHLILAKRSTQHLKPTHPL